MTNCGQIRPYGWLAYPHDNIDRTELIAYFPEYFSNTALDQ